MGRSTSATSTTSTLKSSRTVARARNQSATTGAKRPSRSLPMTTASFSGSGAGALPDPPDPYEGADSCVSAVLCVVRSIPSSLILKPWLRSTATLGG